MVFLGSDGKEKNNFEGKNIVLEYSGSGRMAKFFDGFQSEGGTKTGSRRVQGGTVG